jgi:hypothetical protein
MVDLPFSISRLSFVIAQRRGSGNDKRKMTSGKWQINLPYNFSCAAYVEAPFSGG